MNSETSAAIDKTNNSRKDSKSIQAIVIGWEGEILGPRLTVSNVIPACYPR